MCNPVKPVIKAEVRGTGPSKPSQKHSNGVLVVFSLHPPTLSTILSPASSSSSFPILPTVLEVVVVVVVVVGGGGGAGGGGI